MKSRIYADGIAASKAPWNSESLDGYLIDQPPLPREHKIAVLEKMLKPQYC